MSVQSLVKITHKTDISLSHKIYFKGMRTGIDMQNNLDPNSNEGKIYFKVNFKHIIYSNLL